MGVDAKWGRFPNCPDMSRFVPVCPHFPGFVSAFSAFLLCRFSSDPCFLE